MIGTRRVIPARAEGEHAETVLIALVGKHSGKPEVLARPAFTVPSHGRLAGLFQGHVSPTCAQSGVSGCGHSHRAVPNLGALSGEPGELGRNSIRCNDCRIEILLDCAQTGVEAGEAMRS